MVRYHYQKADVNLPKRLVKTRHILKEMWGSTVHRIIYDNEDKHGEDEAHVSGGSLGVYTGRSCLLSSPNGVSRY